MPPVRMRERGRAKKGTMKRILKQLFKLYPWQLILSLICLIFNVFGNISSSVFVSLATASLTEAGTLGVNPFDQPGVEAYKTRMFELLGKPGYNN